MGKTRVRFAPSPTGYLHIGGARTALFNWLFAKKTGGDFILRIEDTDELRSTQESVKAIFDGLLWLELDWNEGPKPEGGSVGGFPPYFQAERANLGIYKKFSDKLLAEGKAYYCYCTTAELDEMRKKAQLEKRPPKYDGRCRNLSSKQQADLAAQGRKPVIRFRMPDEGSVSFNDMIRGEVKFENKLLYDFVLIKASGFPTYNFACVVDDSLMEITHVIRGDDHVSNTPLQIHGYNALGLKPPQMAHLSMILGADGTKLSKRHGHSSVQEYKKAGYLPQAVRNYLALLGWSTQDSQQIFAPGELEEKFNLEGCQKNPAIFDDVKLKWLNGEYIRKLSPQELVREASPFMKAANVGANAPAEFISKLIVLEQEKYKLLGEIPGLLDFFFKEVEFDPKAVEKTFKPETANILRGIKEKYGAMQNFTDVEIESATRAYAKENGLKNGQVFHPVRVAVSGRAEGPTLFKMIEYLGKEKVLERLKKAISLCGVSA
ncbi:MAG: glutamate--tRNA ligase [Elusimicrobia bacterium]|nr:glutamate--tRNA ligase [Elusimicrobiota bacterium]